MGAEGGEGVHGACDEWSVDVWGLKVVRVYVQNFLPLHPAHRTESI